MENKKIDLDPKYKDKLDIPYLFNKQIDRCLFHSGTPMYDFHVLSLQSLLPQSSYNMVESESDKYSFLVPILEFLAPCGTPIGTKEKPCMLDQSKPVLRLPGNINWDDENIAGAVNISDEEDPIYEASLFNDNLPVKRFQGEIDWTDPNIMSPKKVDDQIRVEYGILFKMILSEAENIGILWDLLKETTVMKIKTSKPQRNPTPNPNYDKDGKKIK